MKTTPMAKSSAEALVVEDDELLGITLVEALARRGLTSHRCRSLAEARATLATLGGTSRVELLILDVLLPDGTGVELLRDEAFSSPYPRVVAISGAARPEQSFELAQLGVECFVPKPIALAAFELALEHVLTEPQDLRPGLRSLVGKRSIAEIENEVRATLVSEAMARAGTLSGAARLLSISRQLLQHILRDIAQRP